MTFWELCIFFAMINWKWSLLWSRWDFSDLIEVNRDIYNGHFVYKKTNKKQLALRSKVDISSDLNYLLSN